MTIRKAMLVTLTLSLSGCASLIQSTSVTEAYKKFEHQEYEQTLALIARAENVKETTPEMKAELIYLKAQSHDCLLYTSPSPRD